MQRPSHRQSDSRSSHDVCVGDLLGMKSPKGMFWGSTPKFSPNIVVKTPRIAGTEHEMYDRVTGLSALVL